ncbi:efflux RND transporter periplasmic adaptor subunit [Pseudochrobactrum sp. HB0163]|uniref:efflux RND transporter periplasmic adaptor subunit n=1 Tax=Pseudochrobactrum sp. HB0163 TaxID=3450708 RepID=UPI003F6DFAEC
MSRKAATLLFAGTILAAGTFGAVYRDGIRQYAANLVTFVSSSVILQAAAQPAQMPAPQVSVAQVITRKIAPFAEFSGHIEAVRAVELRPRVGGAIDAVSVPEGGLVQAGELLFQIDPRPFQVALNAASAELQQAKVLLDQAEIDFRRAEMLTPNGTVSRKTFDDARAARRQRQAQVEIAKAAVARAELDLSFTHVTAPIAGRVDRILVTQGNLVTGGNTGAATLLTTIVSTDPLYVYFDIDEAAYLDFAARARAGNSGQNGGNFPVHIGLMTDTGFPHPGELDFLSNSIDRNTGTIRARAVIKNPDGRLAPGLFTRVKLTTAEPAQTVLIDEQAIGTDQGRRYVLTLGAENKAEYRLVELGPMIDGLRVVTSGLKPGEKIIIKGLVRPGMQVDPQMVSMLTGKSADEDHITAAAQEAHR